MASHRRPRAPSPTHDHLTASYAPALQPRFPARAHDHLDADERKANAQPGKLRKHHLGGLNLAPAEWKILVVVVIIASFVRLYKISYPDSVVWVASPIYTTKFAFLSAIPWFETESSLLELTAPLCRFDEVHFGNFASKYIKTRYFVDVHPPLAKLLITLAAFVGGFDIHFDFKEIGKWVAFAVHLWAQFTRKLSGHTMRTLHTCLCACSLVYWASQLSLSPTWLFVGLTVEQPPRC